MQLLLTDIALLPALAGWALLLPFALASLVAVRRDFLRSAPQQHLWLAGIVAVTFLWHLQAVTGAEANFSLPFGLLGVALFALVFGSARALLGLLAALAAHTLIYQGSWWNFGLNGLLLAVLPALTARSLQRLIEARLPANLFVFLIGHGMFVALAVTAMTSLAILAAGFTVGGLARPDQLADFVSYALLLAWGEALLTGMVFSALVVYVPGLVLTYRQDRYLPPRHG